MSEIVKGLAISNRDASPVVPTVAALAGGKVLSGFGRAPVSASAAGGSTYPLVSVPSNARVQAVKFQSAAQGGSCTVNIGVYAPTQPIPALVALNSGYTPNAAINATFFTSALAVSSAVAQTDEKAQSTTYTMAKQEKELWDALGLASDPGCMLDIVVALQAASSSGGDIALDVNYSI